MRPTLAACSRYRPRLLTLVLLAIIAALIVLANLSADYGRLDSFEAEWQQFYGGQGKFGDEFYGWPLTWHRFVIAFTPTKVVGWYYSAGRLAGNVALWLVMLAAPAGICEWLVRRYRPRLRWSLRAMLAGIGLSAAGCAWFVAARERAENNEQIFAAINGRKGEVWVERWGPKWLDLIGVDRYRQRIIGMELGSGLPSRQMALRAGNEGDEDLIRRLARLPHMRYLFLNVDRLSPAIADALAAMPRLRTLSIQQPRIVFNNQAVFGRCLEAIGNMAHLEYLDLSNVTGDRVSPECLASLTNLKWLRVSHGHWYSKNLNQPDSDEWLAAIGKMTRLESLELAGLTLSTENLASLAGLKNIETLLLRSAGDGGRPFTKRRPIGRLPALPGLKRLELHSFEIATPEVQFFAALRRARPGIVIDTDSDASRLPHQDWPGMDKLRFNYEALPEHRPAWLPASGAPWMTAAEQAAFEGEGGWARFDAAGWPPGDGPTTEF
jgi:hypothetical protein